MARRRPITVASRASARLGPVRLALLFLLVLLGSGLGGSAAGSQEMRAPAFVATGASRVTDSGGAEAPPRQADETDQTPLRTVGGDSPTLTGETEQDLRSQSGSLLAASDSAWRHLTRNERAILLDGQVAWVPYDAAVAADPERQDLLAPIVAFADALDADGVDPPALFVNEVVLALPAAKLGPALAEREPQAIAIGPDVVLLVDQVVVARIKAAADRVSDVSVGAIDDRGLIVASESPSPDDDATAAPDQADNAAEAPRKRSAAGEPIPRITLDELPLEAIATLILIYQGGPFPFERDGAVFGNYEERLPAAPFGSYREYTVITPGADDRGARRIVTGNNDTEFYYTDDHYETFVEVIITDE